MLTVSSGAVLLLRPCRAYSVKTKRSAVDMYEPVSPSIAHMRSVWRPKTLGV
jgi:hypothetical protein